MLAIDPGLAGTGWAYFKGRKLKQCGVITPPSSLEWDQKIPYIVNALWDIATDYPDKSVVCEMPQHMQSAGGQLSARAGSVIKLAMLVGAIRMQFGENVELVTPQRWKGQLKKRIVEKRIRSKLPKTVARLRPRSHSWDAIGIGLWKLGRF